jgi:hypothetical protein
VTVPRTWRRAPAAARPGLACAALLTVLAACGLGPDGSAEPVEVTVHRSGGIAGVDEVLVVHADGRWTWNPGARSRGTDPRTGRLGDRDRRELARLAAQLDLDAVPGRRRPPECADGFEYTVTAGGNRVQWVDCGTNGPLVASTLVDLLAAATPL